MKKNVYSREEAESMEKMPEIANDVPENRQQKVQQIAKTADAEKIEAPKTGFATKRSKGKGAALKQQVISDMITGSSPTTGMGINFAGRSVSGTSGGILGAANSTPEAEKSRRDSRVGKKLDRAATKLNYTPCENVIIDVDESKPLADAADLDQGYNGTYRNEFARSQKIAGAVPGDLMYQRSVDLITKDKLYFVEGQQVFQVAGERTSLNPSITIDPAQPESKQERNVTYHSGNYLHKALHVGLKDNGDADYCYFEVEDLTPDTVTAEEANMASAHRLIKANIAELDRMNMDAKAGDEKGELWTPLARAINQPTRAAYLMSSIEADTGAYEYLAYSKATVNMSYQLNRAAKDGLDVDTPAIEQLVGWRAAVDDSAAFKSTYSTVQSCFDDDYYRLGDPSLMIAAYDSVAKYNNKADLLLQPRGWRMHLQTADNNMNPLYVPKEFANVYAATEVYSTIDHDYDPALPVCMTDKANLITVHNMNELAGFANVIPDAQFTGTWTKLDPSKSDYEEEEVTLFRANIIKAAIGLGYTHLHIGYKNAADPYKAITPTVDHTYVDTPVEAQIVFDASGTNGDRKIDFKFIFSDKDTSPVVTGYTFLTGLALNQVTLVSISVPKVQSHTYNAVTASVFAKGNVEKLYAVGAFPYIYRYSDLRNKYIVQVKHPLVEGILAYLRESIGAKFKSLLGQEDFLIPFIFSAQNMTLAQLIICAATPWITRVRANSMKDVLYLEDNVGFYPYSKLENLKQVPFKNYVNFIFRDYDSPLETKVMDAPRAINWILPEFFWKVATEKYVCPWYTNENDLNASDGSVNDDAANMSMPSIRSGYRLGALDTLYGMTEKDIRLSIDRLTKSFFNNTNFIAKGAYKYGLTTDGQIFVCLDSGQVISLKDILACPRELGLTMDAPLGLLTCDPADNSENKFAGNLKAITADGTATSYRIRVWVNPKTNKSPSILSASEVNIDRGANYTQKWYELVANNAVTNTSIAGLVFGMNDEGAATYVPFATLGKSAAQDLSNGVTIVSHQRAMNTRLQFLPFIISPFDAVTISGATPIDIYDMCYYFGLAGFRASDYRESVYNREKEVVNQGLLFVEDPWVIDSPIIREGISSTGIVIGKGYQL